MHIQSKVRQLIRAPGSIDLQIIEKDRESLTTLMNQLKQAQHEAKVSDIFGTSVVGKENLEIWDDIVYEPVNSSPESIVPPVPPANPAPAPAPVSSQQLGPPSIEDQLLSLPSNNNIDPIHRQLECTHRISLADHHLEQIRNLIAEKSFQYSHLIRCSPRKSITTRSRAAVKRLNERIALHCRLYSRYRSRIVTLGAESATLSRLRILSPVDIKASTAIVNPNEQGSTRLKLSWIWQSAGGHRFGLATEENDSDTGTGASYDTGRSLECKSFHHHCCAMLTFQ